MNQTLPRLRRLLLIVLLVWGTADDLVVAAPEPVEVRAQSESFILPPGWATERPQPAPAVREPQLKTHNSGCTPAAFSKPADTLFRPSPAERLYTLMSFQR